MSNTVTAAKPGVSGGVYIAPVGTALPTSASATLASDFKTLGHISSDGVTNSNSPSTGTIKDWNGDDVLVLYNEKEDTFKFKLIDASSEDVLKFVYGSSNVTSASSEISIDAKNSDMTAYPIVIDMILKGGKAKRITIPAGAVTSVSDIVYKSDDAIAYEVTVTCCKTATDDSTHHEYIAI